MQTPSVPDLRLVLQLLLCLLLAESGRAALKIEVLNERDPIRTEALITLQVKITNPGPAIAEGRLETTLRHGDQIIFTHRSQELALPAGAQVMPLLLPPAPGLAGARVERVAHFRFLSQSGSQDLGAFPLTTESVREQRVIARVISGKPREVDLQAAQGFQSSDSGALVRVVWLQPEDLPAHPLAFCSYDQVVLSPDGFAALRERQFTALARWLDGGGRATVFAPQKLGEAQAAFLQAIGRDEEESPYRVSNSGTLENFPDRGVYISPGLGRVIVTRAEAYATVARLPTAAELAARDQRVPEIPAGVREAMEHARSSKTKLNFAEDDQQLEAEAAAAVTTLLPRLLPGAPRPMPLSQIIGLMLLLIFIVVPCDYFFLGWLRRRRWTWLAFPVAAGGFTAWMLWLAHRHMNAFEQSGTLRLVDLGQDGRVLREMRFTIILPAVSRAGTVENKSAVPLPFELGRLGPRPSLYLKLNNPDTQRRINRILSPNWSFASSFSPPDSPPLIEGPLTGRSVLVRNYEQWTPITHATWSLPNTPDDSGLRWDNWRPTRAFLSSLTLPARLPELTQALGASPEWKFAVHTSMEISGFETDPDLQSLAALMEGFRSADRPRAPSGGLSLDQLVFDDRRSDTVQLLAVRRDGPNITAYRKFHRLAP